MPLLKPIETEYGRLATELCIPNPEVQAIKYTHRNDLSPWDALGAVLCQFLKWNVDKVTVTANRPGMKNTPNRRWLIDAVRQINVELAADIQTKFLEG